MKVSIIIPIRNEENVLKNIIQQLENKLETLTFEVIFINDFSTDDTFSTLEKLIKNKKRFWY